MNEQSKNDHLEQELRNLQPRELSDGFMESLGRRLDMSPVVRESTRRQKLVKVSVAGAVAAMLLIALWGASDLLNHDAPVPPEREIAGPKEAPRQEKPDEPPKPTLFAYSLAASGQQGDLEELLDYHARTLLPTVTDSNSVAYP